MLRLMNDYRNKKIVHTYLDVYRQGIGSKIDYRLMLLEAAVHY